MVDRVYQCNATAAPPAAPDAPSEGYPTNGNPAGAIPATIPGAYWYYMITESLRNVIVAAGLDPDHEDLGQLVAALAALAPAQNIAVFDTAGITEWQVPQVLKDGRSKAYVVIKGPGGSGAYEDLADSTGPGGGGAGGITEGVVDLSGVESVPVTVGAGGVPVTSIGNGNDGGTSSFGTYGSATSGGGGQQTGAGGASGAGAGLDFSGGLGDGQYGNMSQPGNAAGGNGGGPGGGYGAAGSGGDGQLPGAGGGGTATAPSGAGADGIVIVRW